MSHRYPLVLVPLLTAIIAYVCAPFVARLAIKIGAVDHPDARKIHQRPMPRLGGLAVIIAAGVTLALAPLFGGPIFAIPAPLGRGLLLGLLPIIAISIVDDIRPVPARIKLLCHLIGAVLAVSSGIALPPRLHILSHEFSIGLLAIPISIIWLTGVTNAFNIIDGLDGLAAGLAFIAAVAVSAVFISVGQLASAILPLALAGAIAGFLPYNMYPARMFLGDTGATAIGFALAVVAIKGGAMMSAGFAAATPVLIMGLPIADTLVAIARRALRWFEHGAGGVFQPDRNHVHHRLLALGLNHQNAVRVLYGLGALTAAVAYASMFVSSSESALLLMALLTAGVIGLRRLGYDEFAWLRRGTILRFYEAPVLRRSMFIAFVDVGFVCLSAYLAVGLKTDDWLLRTQMPLVLQTAICLVPLSIFTLWKARVYEGSWRLASIADYVRALQACVLAVLLAIVVYSWQFRTLPLSLLVVYGMVNVFLVVGSRASYRVLVSAQRVPGRAGTPALIYGPGPEDFLRARDLIDRAGSFGLRPVGFVTPTGAGKGNLLAGVKIWGSIAELPTLVKMAGAEAAVMARRRVPDLAIQEFEELCRRSQVIAYRLNTELEILSADADEDSTTEVLVTEFPASTQRLRDSVELTGWPTYKPSNSRKLSPTKYPRPA